LALSGVYVGEQDFVVPRKEVERYTVLTTFQAKRTRG